MHCRAAASAMAITSCLAARHHFTLCSGKRSRSLNTAWGMHSVSLRRSARHAQIPKRGRSAAASTVGNRTTQRSFPAGCCSRTTQRSFPAGRVSTGRSPQARLVPGRLRKGSSPHQLRLLRLWPRRGSEATTTVPSSTCEQRDAWASVETTPCPRTASSFSTATPRSVGSGFCALIRPLEELLH